MKHKSNTYRSLVAGLCFALLPAASQAACYADYKAKRDNPLKLHYGVAEVSDDNCSPQAAHEALMPRLAADGWVLLSVINILSEGDLEGVKESAGAYFLRY